MKKILLLLLFANFAKAQVINFPDANFKAALLSANATNRIAQGSSGWMAVDANGDGEIQVSEALMVTSLQFEEKSIADFSGIENFSNLSYFGSYRNPVNDFRLNGLQLLRSINISGNTSSNTVFNFLNLPSLESFTFIYSKVTSFTLTNLISLKQINIWYNDRLETLNLLGLTALEKIEANDCSLANLLITDSPMLKELNVTTNKLTNVSISNFPALKILILTNNLLTNSTGITNINNLEELRIGQNPIFDLVLPTPLPLLRTLVCNNTNLSTIDLSGYPKLEKLYMSRNSIATVDFSNNPLIYELSVSYNLISDLNVDNLSLLKKIDCSQNRITELDFSYNRVLDYVEYAYNPNLISINLKNGLANDIRYGTNLYGGVPNLRFICIDEGDTFSYPLVTPVPTVPISSYCSFTPGGDYNTITGKTIFDSNSNGCDVSDFAQPFIKVKINDGTNAGATFTNTAGNYKFYTQAGNFTVTPEMENPAFFNVSPATATVNFPLANNSVSTNNFCLSANGNHPDLEIVVAPAIPARPGFEAVYKVVYKNKGNQTMSQHYGISFFYNQHLASFLSATIAPESNVAGSLNWSYANLMPFESRSFYVTLRINAPTATNPVNIDDVLTFTASIMPVAGDATVADNLFAYDQTVVGSYDPNDITCLQGDSVPASEIGNYLHYMIRFENTGNYHAENVVVKETIDLAKYDIESLQVLGTSHAVDARIRGNIAEFIFQSINLDSGGHGNVLLKLKSKSTLVTGDQVSKKASIYFDYNYPIVTNDANTVFQALSIGEHHLDNSIKMYPNPANEFVSIKASGLIKSVEFYDVQGRILQTNLVNETEAKLDLSKYASGIYYLKIKTDKGYKVEKLIKK